MNALRPTIRFSRGIAAFLALGLSTGVAATAPRAALAQPGDANAGKAVYERKCLLCHGEKGDGNGPAAELLDPRPRDFTTGVYKVRSTSSKSPSDQDLFRIISAGMPGTSMPGWTMLPEKDRWNLVAYVKTFAADKFKTEAKKMDLPPDVASSPDSIKRGKEMFGAIECNKCHGDDGRADGPSRAELVDEAKRPIRPANLTKRWNFRGGSDRREIAMRIATGMQGTPMPSFVDSVEFPADIWHLTNYVLSLGPPRAEYATLITARAVNDAIPADAASPFWSTVPGQAIPLMGQVIIDPRNFNPSIDMVTVRAAWNDREVAFHLTWDDPTASKADTEKKTFDDAISLQFSPKLDPSGERPYFLLGDANDAVYLLRWEQGRGVFEAAANGPTKLSALNGSEAAGAAVHAKGQYRLVMKRALAAKDASRTAFGPGVFMPIAFQAWDGGAGEGGARMSLTSWYYLRLEERESKARFVIPPLVTLVTMAAMVLVVRAVNRRG